MLTTEDIQSYLKKMSVHPRGTQLWSTWEHLLDNDQYTAHLKRLLSFKKGVDPLPDRDTLEQLLRGVGHDFAALESLRPGNLLTNLLRWGHINLEDYMGLHATIAARLVNSPSPLGVEDVVRLYDTLDRLLRGGEAWSDVTEVPAVTAGFYNALREIRIPGRVDIGVWLGVLMEDRIKQRLGDHYKDVATMSYCSFLLLTAAAAYRNGRRVATPDDAMDAGFAYANLFERDLHSLPTLVRTGHTGYELAS